MPRHLRTPLTMGVFAVVLIALALSFGCCPQPHVVSGTEHTGSLLLFDELWDYNDPAATEKTFVALLPKAEQQGEVSYHLQLLTQIARAQGLQGRFEEANRTLDDIEPRLETAPEVVRVRYLLERGRVLNSAGERDKALTFFVEAWEVGKRHRLHYYAVDAAHMMGIIASPDQALVWSEKAIAYAEGSGDQQARRWLASLHDNLGWAYFDMGRLDKALEMLRLALVYREERGQTDKVLFAKWGVGKVLRAQGKIDEALTIQEDALAGHQKEGTVDGYLYEELAELYLSKGRKEEARRFFALAYEELSKDPWTVENEKKKLHRLRSLGGVSK